MEPDFWEFQTGVGKSMMIVKMGRKLIFDICSAYLDFILNSPEIHEISYLNLLHILNKMSLLVLKWCRNCDQLE